MNKEQSDILYEVKISTQMQDLWDKIGIDEQGRKGQTEELVSAIQDTYNSTIKRLEDEYQRTKNEINEVQAKHRKAMIAFGMDQAEIDKNFLPLKEDHLLQQLAQSKQAYDGFKLVCADRISKLEKLIHVCNGLFNELGIPKQDRGEFAELGETDLTRERCERFKLKIEELENQKTQRANDIAHLRKQINKVAKEIGRDINQEQALIDISLTQQHLTQLQELHQSLEEEKTKRVSTLSEIAVTITHLWDLLHISIEERASFLQAHNDVSDSSISDAKIEVNRLSKLRDEQLPALIDAQYAEVEKLWNYLHISIESRQKFHQDPYDTTRMKEFLFIEGEVLRLKKLAIEWHPILELIEQRDTIISEYEELKAVTSDPHRLTSRDHGSAQLLMKEEKARRRYKFTLPRLEKSLKELLIEYKEKNSIDFEWDGAPYIDRLTHVVLDEPKKKRLNVEDSKKSKTLPLKHQGPINENIPQQQIYSIRI